MSNKHKMPNYEFGNYKFMNTSMYMDTESLSVNPWSPVAEQEQRVHIERMLVEVGFASGDVGVVEDEQDFDYIARYHAPINY